MQAPLDCALCPRLVASRRAVVNGAGPVPARLMVVGQNPGRSEEMEGVPLCGWSGRRLDYLAGLAGIPPGTYRKENVCRCRPPRGSGGDLPLKPAEIANCAPYLLAAVRQCRPEVIVTLGAPAARWFLPGAKLEEVHGRPFPYTPPEASPVQVVPMYHPAAAYPSRAAANPNLAQTMIDDWRRLGRMLAGEVGGSLGRYKEVGREEVCMVGGSPLAIDFETTDPRWHGTFQAVRARPIGIAVSIREGEAIYWASEDMAPLKTMLEDPAIAKVAHNAAFEYIVARGCGIRPANLHCTKLMAYLLRRPSTHLKDLSWSEFGVAQTRFGEVDWADPAAVAQYSGADADLTLRLFQRFSALLCSEGLWELYEIERATLPVLAEMTIRGICFDCAPIKALEARLVAERAALLDNLLKFFNADVNLNSDKQLSTLLYGPPHPSVLAGSTLQGRFQHTPDCKRKGCVGTACAEGVRTGAQTKLRWLPPGLGWPVKRRTEGGAPAVDMDTLRLYKAPVVADLVKWKSITQALENNVTRLPQLVQEGRIHPTFHQAGQWEERTGTAREAPITGRLSSSGPNLQNITHHGDAERPYVSAWAVEIRRAFTASPGMVLFRADVGQEEPRIAAFLAGDDDLLHELDNGDVYCPVASLEFGRTITKQDREERQIGKRGWMAWLNGAGYQGIQESAFWLSRGEAEGVVRFLQNRHPRIEAFRRELVVHLQEAGYTRTYFGRRIYRPWTGINRDHTERSVMPDAIQGTAADVMKVWLARLKLPSGAHLLLTIHDEIVGECYPHQVVDIRQLLESTLASILPLKLPCEFSTGPNWADMV